MSIRFSRVTLIAENKMAIFLVSGCPRREADFQGWKAYEDFIKSNQSKIVAHIETFLYGGEEPVDATPEEVAYIYKRVSMRPDFIEKRTEKISETDIVLRS